MPIKWNEIKRGTERKIKGIEIDRALDFDN